MMIVTRILEIISMIMISISLFLLGIFIGLDSGFSAGQIEYSLGKNYVHKKIVCSSALSDTTLKCDTTYYVIKPKQ